MKLDVQQTPPTADKAAVGGVGRGGEDWGKDHSF